MTTASLTRRLGLTVPSQPLDNLPAISEPFCRAYGTGLLLCLMYYSDNLRHYSDNLTHYSDNLTHYSANLRHRTATLNAYSQR